MIKQLDDVEFGTRTIGPLVLTTPVLQRLGFREIVDGYCPIVEQAELSHGLVAKLGSQNHYSSLVVNKDAQWKTLLMALKTHGQKAQDDNHLAEGCSEENRRSLTTYQAKKLGGERWAHSQRTMLKQAHG